MLNKKIRDIEIECPGYAVQHSSFDGEYQSLEISALRIFAQALTVSKILAFKMFDLESLGQSHEVGHL